jgi:Rrf2 family transcriptional regulator, iron-sulfur cluster assembly transcription factor
MEMRRSNIVVSIRGSQGGYQLARHPSKISLGEILLSVGESLEPLSKHQPSDSEDAEDWVTFAVWNRLHQKLEDVLASISLEDLYFDARSWQAAQGSETGFVV